MTWRPRPGVELAALVLPIAAWLDYLVLKGPFPVPFRLAFGLGPLAYFVWAAWRLAMPGAARPTEDNSRMPGWAFAAPLVIGFVAGQAVFMFEEYGSIGDSPEYSSANLLPLQALLTLMGVLELRLRVPYGGVWVGAVGVPIGILGLGLWLVIILALSGGA